MMIDDSKGMIMAGMIALRAHSVPVPTENLSQTEGSSCEIVGHFSLMKGETGTSAEKIATHYSHRSEGPGTHRGRIVDKRSTNGDERALF